MPATIFGRGAAIAALASLFAAPLVARSSAQEPAPARPPLRASAFVALDDPSLPLIEHLIARGDIDDPSPMVRPFRRADARRVLAAADSTAVAPAILRELRQRYAEPDAEAWWGVAARAGAQAYTQLRREPLHLGGPDGAKPYADVSLEAGFANVIAVTRPAIEPRVVDDPDWTGRRGIDLAGRLVEGYVGAQFRFIELTYGQLDHNWGPAGLPGIPLSNYGYERQGLMLSLGTPSLRLTALATDLRDGTDSGGVSVHRYYFVHRLGVRLSRRLDVALWEGNVVSGAGRNFETRYRNPLSFSYLTNTIGLGDDRGNVMLGADLRWRAARGLILETQLALDDFWYQDRDQNRDRWAFTVAGSGPLGRRAGWRALYTQVSSLALRAFNRAENFTDGGVGIGRNFSDQDQLTLRVSVPVRSTWLFTPEATLLRQGEGRIEDPYPALGSAELAATPALFIGTVERTWRLALGLSGRQGPLAITADAGVHHVINAGHVAGARDDRFVARVQATLGISRRGTLRTD